MAEKFPTPSVSPASSVSPAGYEQRTFTNEYGIDVTIRSPISGHAASGRDRSGDHHMQLPHTAMGGSAVDSSVSGVKVNGKTYTVSISNETGGDFDGSKFIGIAPDSDRMNDILSLSEKGMTPHLKKLVKDAVSPHSPAGAGLSYSEAQEIAGAALHVRTPKGPKVPTP